MGMMRCPIHGRDLTGRAKDPLLRCLWVGENGERCDFTRHRPEPTSKPVPLAPGRSWVDAPCCDHDLPLDVECRDCGRVAEPSVETTEPELLEAGVVAVRALRRDLAERAERRVS